MATAIFYDAASTSMMIDTDDANFAASRVKVRIAIEQQALDSVSDFKLEVEFIAVPPEFIQDGSKKA